MSEARQTISLASKTVRTGIVCALLAIGLLGLGTFASGSDLSKEESAVVHQEDVKKMQQILYGKGHYRGKVDGVFGLRTRASIRAFQKTENLPATGQLDAKTAGKLGVSPEAIGVVSYGAGQEVEQVTKETSHETTKGKPSAGIVRAQDSGRTRKMLPKVVKTPSNLESGRRDREKKLQAENENHPQ